MKTPLSHVRAMADMANNFKSDCQRSVGLLSVVHQMMNEYADELSPLGPGLDLYRYQLRARGSVTNAAGSWETPKWSGVIS